jgi:hypothetical protein
MKRPEVSMDRETLTAPAPGDKSNGVVLVSGADKCAYGVGNPRNVGQVGLIIAALDASGASTDPDDFGLYLLPDASVPYFRPASGTATMLLIGDPAGVGTAILEYDLPIA